MEILLRKCDFNALLSEGGINLHIQLMNDSTKLISGGDHNTQLKIKSTAAKLLKDDWGVESDVWSVPSFSGLRRDGQDVERWNLLHPTESPKQSHVEQCLSGKPGPVIAATDYVRGYAEMIRPFVKAPYHVLGTDGFGRSDSRENLRNFFEVDRYWIAVKALRALVDEDQISSKQLAEAIEKYGLDINKPNPLTV